MFFEKKIKLIILLQINLSDFKKNLKCFRLQTQAGTYVKEFVHSDFGRTRPSIGSLMGIGIDDVDILELDVEGVDFDWPPKFAVTR